MRAGESPPHRTITGLERDEGVCLSSQAAAPGSLVTCFHASSQGSRDGGGGAQGRLATGPAP